MKRLIAVLLVLLLCVSLASCEIKFGSAGDADETTAPAPSAVSSQIVSSVVEATLAPTPTLAPAPTMAPVTSSVSSKSTSGGKYATVQEMLDDTDIQKEIEDSMGDNEQVSLEVYAEGDDTLVYNCSFKQHLDDAQAASAKVTLDEYLEEQGEDTFGPLLTQLETYVDQPNPKIKVIYSNDDGTVITSKVYSK